MELIKSKYSNKVIMTLILLTVSTMLLSLFLLQIFISILFLLFLFDFYQSKKKTFDIFSKLVLVFLLVRITTSFFSENPSESYSALVREIYFYLSFFSFSLFLKTLSEESLKKIITWFYNFGVIVAILGIAKFISGVPRAESITSGPATFATYLTIVLAVLLFKSLEEGEENKTWIKQALVFSGIFLVLARTHIAIALLLFLTGIVFKKIKFSSFMKTLLLTAVVSSVAIFSNSYYFNVRKDDPMSYSNRDVIWGGALKLNGEHPILGFGPGSFKGVFPDWNILMDKGVSNWHSEWIQMYIESGVLGLSISLIIAGFVFYMYAKRRNSLSSSKLLTPIFAGLVTLYLSSVTNCILYSIIPSILFGFLLAFYSRVISVEDVRLVGEKL